MINIGLLELAITNILPAIYPSEEDWNIRHQIINDIRMLIQSLPSLTGASVEPYGSFVSNMFTKWGDVDVSIEMANGLYISCSAKKHKLKMLEELQNALTDGGNTRNLRFIATARIPILKFETKFNVSCDISVDNLSGQMKSKILFWINEIDGRFRNMVLLVKEWAKSQQINDAKSGSFNSYSLTLLVLFHLQTCVPPILPPLREIYPGNMVDDLTGVRVNAERHIEETCLHGINRYKGDLNKPINKSFLSEVFFSFIEKFCDISPRASVQGMSPHEGKWGDIETNMRWNPKTYALLIEDPFDRPANAAKSVDYKTLVNISDAFQTTYNVLMTPNLDRRTLITTLVGPHVSDLLTGGPFAYQGSHSNSNNHGNRFRPNGNGRFNAAYNQRWPDGHMGGYNEWRPNTRSNTYNSPNIRGNTYNNRRPNRGPNRGRGEYNGRRPNGNGNGGVCENNDVPENNGGTHEYINRRNNGEIGEYQDWRPDINPGVENGKRPFRKTGSEKGKGGHNGSVGPGKNNRGNHEASTSTSTENDRRPNASTEGEYKHEHRKR